MPCAFLPVVLLNLAIAWLGDTHVNPLSFSYLEAKVGALSAYAAHRPSCLVNGHEPLEPLIDAAERRHRLPAGLLRALVKVESESRVHRISPVGAMGPGQLMPTTAAMLGVEDPFDPAPAIDASARYLAEQLRRFRDVRLAVAAYNAGPGAVNGRVPRNGETEFYVPKVLAAWEHTRPAAPVVVAARTAPRATTPRSAPAVKPAAPPKPVLAAKPAAPPKPVLAAKPAAPPKPAPAAKPRSTLAEKSPARAPVSTKPAVTKPAARTKPPASADAQPKPSSASARRG
nr:lytic transglycosylase domain-containing protein [Pyxidicoccus fallax]